MLVREARSILTKLCRSIDLKNLSDKALFGLMLMLAARRQDRTRIASGNGIQILEIERWQMFVCYTHPAGC